MASTTTNYGFDVPTSSDLVKNGATAISTLGQDIDTFLFRPFTRNGLLNSSLNVWQRGTSISLSASSGVVYTADRWSTSTNANQACTVSRQATGDTTNLPNIQYAMRFQRNSGQTGTGLLLTTQSLETTNSIPFVGKTVVVSFYARAGANFSSASSILINYLMTGTGTDQNRQSGAYTGEVTASNNATLTTTWQRFSYSYTVGATATEVATGFAYTPVGTASTNDYFEVTGVMLEIGNQVSPYAPATPTYQSELAACQRYYYRTSTPNAAGGYISPAGVAATTTRFDVSLNAPVTMRVGATAIDYANLQVRTTAGAAKTITAATLDSVSGSNAQVRWSASTFVVGDIGFLETTTTGGYYGLSAEL